MIDHVTQSFYGPAAEAWCRVLLHSLWQATAIAACLAVLLRKLPSDRASLRYGLACTALLAVVLAGSVTHALIRTGPALSSEFSAESTATPPATSSQSADAIRLDLKPAPTQPAADQSLDNHDRARLPAVRPDTQKRAWTPQVSAVALGLWASGAGLLLLRTVGGLVASRRLTAAATRPPDPAWVGELQQLRIQLAVRRPVRLLLSGAASVPMVVGALHPVIVLPPVLAAGLTAEQLRIVLAHELAHVRRWDVAVNLLQRVVEALLFFNPAVWWISRQVRVEREACCDLAAAAAVDGDRLGVARTLVDVLQRVAPAAEGDPPAVGTARVAVALGGQRDWQSVGDRVRRLVRPGPSGEARLPWRSLAVAFAVVAIGLATAFYSTRVTVVVAQHVLDPRQHVDQARELVQQARAAWPEGRVGEDGQVLEQDRVTVAGTIRTFDGRPLDQSQMRLTIRSEGPSRSSTTDIRATSDPDRPGTLTFRHEGVTPGRVMVWARGEGYAPGLTDTVPIQPGGEHADFDLVLSEGFDLPVRVVDPDGRPIEGVQLTDFMAYTGTSGQGFSAVVPPTDAEGRSVIPHLGRQKITARVNHPGYARARFETNPEPGGPWMLTLRPVEPLVGRVLSEEDGRPLADASLWIVAWSDRQISPRSAIEDGGPADARTDAAGVFRFDSLDPADAYGICVSAPGHAPRVIMQVSPAQLQNESWEIRLRPKIDLWVEIHGTADQHAALPRDRQGRVRVSLNQSLQILPDQYYGGSTATPLDLETSPPSAEMRGPIFDGEAQISVGGVRVTLPDVRRAAEGGEGGRVRLDLNPPPAERPATRRVVLRLEVPAGWPPPEGTLAVTYHAKPTDAYRSKQELPIRDGQVEFEVRLDEEAHQYTVEELLAPGYWLPRVADFAERWVRVGPGEGPYRQTLQLRPAGVIRGRVVDAEGRPVPQARLSLSEVEPPADAATDPNWWNNLEADGEGRFIISPVPLDGVYRVVAGDRRVSRYAMGSSADLTMSPATPQPEAEVVVPRGRDVAVRVVDPDGRPMVGAAVEVTRSASRGSHGWSPAERTDADGRVVIVGLNFEPTDTVWRVSVPPTLGFRGVVETLDPDSPGVTITLSPGVSLRGQAVHDLTGQPLAGATVYARGVYDPALPARYGGEITATADAEGRFTFEGIEPGGDYYFGVKDAAHTMHRHTVDIEFIGQPLLISARSR